VYDIEVYADAYEVQEAYALECNLEQDMEELRLQLEAGREECAKWDALMLEIEAADVERSARQTRSSAPVQTAEETRMFEEWLS